MPTFSVAIFSRYITSVRVLVPLFIIVGLVGLSFSTIVRNPYTIAFPIALLTGVGAFIFLRNRRAVSLPEIQSSPLKLVFSLYFSTVFVLFLQYHLSGNSRTVSVFLLTFLLYLFSALVIVFRPHPQLGLGIICLTGLINRFTAYYSSALYTGVDIFGHVGHVHGILDGGSLATLAENKYFFAPFYHLFVSAGSLVLSLPVRDTNALLAVTAVTVVPALAVYLLANLFWNTRIALLSSLLYIGSDFAISWGVATQPTSFGIVLYSLLIFALIRYLNRHKIRDFVLFGLILVFLTFTHQVSLFITTVGVVSIVSAHLIYTGQIHSRLRNVFTLTIILVFIDFTVTKYAGPGGEFSFFDQVLLFIIGALSQAGIWTRSEFTLPNDPTLFPTGAASLSMLQVSGSAFLLFLGVVGTLAILDNSRTSRSYGSFILGSVVAVLLLFALAGPVVGMRSLLPFRWFGFIYVPLSILAAFGLLYISRHLGDIDSSRLAVPVCVTVFVLLAFPYLLLMGGNATAASDGPLFDAAPGAERMSVTDSEEMMYHHTVDHTESQSVVLADGRAALLLTNYYDRPTNIISIDYNNPDSIEKPSILVERAYLHEPQAQYQIHFNLQLIRVHGAFPVQDIDPHTQTIIYDSGDHQLRELAEDN